MSDHDRHRRDAQAGPVAGPDAFEGSSRGMVGSLVDRFGPAGAQRIVQRRLALRRSDAAPAAALPANATAVAEAGLSGPGSSLPAAGVIAPHLGADLGGVRAHVGPRAQAACDALGADAYALGDQIAFRDPTPSLGLQAHEATHVVQQGAVATRTPQRFSAAAPDEQEREADAVAVAVAGPNALPARDQSAWAASPQPIAGRVQRFAPAGHRQATMSGLAGSFGTEEIGQIYAANWERDFSQGNPKIADLVLAWKEVKLAANGQGDFHAASDRFQSAMTTVLAMGKMEATDESLGGYRSWEHLDNPGGDEANKRWGIQKQKADELPGYIRDGRAYLQDHMVRAVDVYRDGQKLASAGAFDPWQGHQKPKGYDEPKKVKEPAMSRDAIATDTAAMASDQIAAEQQQTAAPRTLKGEKSDFAPVAQHLGRATHVLEDFFAHSNWLELAKQLKKSQTSSGTPAPSPGNLITGTFEMPDKCHALGHKLLAIATALQKDFALLLEVFGRDQASTVLDQKEHAKDKKKVLGALETDSSTLLGEIWDVGSAAGDVNSLSRDQNKGVTVADIATNRDWLAALERKGRRMIEHGDESSPSAGHGKIAKDQPEADHGGVHKDYDGAHRLAVAADRAIIAPLAAIMRAEDGGQAHQLLGQQLQLVDQIMAPPSGDHPFMSLVVVEDK